MDAGAQRFLGFLVSTADRALLSAVSWWRGGGLGDESLSFSDLVVLRIPLRACVANLPLSPLASGGPPCVVGVDRFHDTALVVSARPARCGLELARRGLAQTNRPNLLLAQCDSTATSTLVCECFARKRR